MEAAKPLGKPSRSRPYQSSSEPIAAEPTKAEIMEDIRIGLQQADAGEGRPAKEAFKELRQKIYGNAHTS